MELRPRSCKVRFLVLEPAGLGVIDVVARGKLGRGDGAKEGVTATRRISSRGFLVAVSTV